MFRFFFFAGLFVFPQSSFGQLFQTQNYPTTDFRNPLNIPIQLAANFGELRANHYHMGLDIRTDHRENLPVFAAADGYVFRIKIEPFGFGQAIYIRHTNGYVTLYAHLNAFYPALAAYVKQKQYEQERWDVSLDLPPGLLTVKKGDLIAYSGNRGGSQGPHLHFEIRRFPDDVNLNPMLFGLPIPDHTAPVLRGLSVYDRNGSFYEQFPAFVPVKGNAGHFTTAQPLLILKTSNPGFGIAGFDTQTGSTNPNGIYQAVMYDQGIEVSGFQMDHISYNDTRGINAHIDYPTRERGGPYYQLLFRLPGYTHSIYREMSPGGYLHLEDGKLHYIRIEVKDADGNTSNLEFKVRYESAEKMKEAFSGKLFYPGLPDAFESANCAFYLGEKCLYDSVHIVFLETIADIPEAVSSVYHIGTMQVPLADSLTVKIKPNRWLNLKDRILMQWFDPQGYEVKKPAWLGDWATAGFKNFGNFQLVLDTVSPIIRFPGIVENANLHRSSRIAVLVTDNYKSVRNFKATLDGKWLLFSNDKARAFIYNFDEHCAPGKHVLNIYAEDEAGNASAAVLHFSR